MLRQDQIDAIKDIAAKAHELNIDINILLFVVSCMFYVDIEEVKKVIYG